MNQSTNSNASIVAGWISLISNIVLTILKIVVGTLFHSPVLLADGYHNAGDVIASGAALTSMRISKRPADEDHPYGHGKAEVISSAIVGIILIIAAFYIAYESIKAFFQEPEKASLIAFITAIISLVWKLILYFYTIKIGKRTNSKGLIATAYDHLADVYASIAAVLGIGLALVGEHFHISILTYGDPIAGIIVTILVFKLAYGMLLEAIDTLMEKSVSRETLDNFEMLIRTIPEVKRIDRLRAREHGHYVLVDLRVSVPGELTIQEGHDIIRKIKKTIMAQHQNVEEVLIHLNPWYDNLK
ncbi:cation diffusion facilitator family transporter [Lysinibacillus sp. NPDC097195]|uniref:cation diffusion facilitator family transporter n=1 Tax=Lysinibacillus sp. NPDC097195 TaxID=3364141 RepID=UPI00380110AA